GWSRRFYRSLNRCGSRCIYRDSAPCRLVNEFSFYALLYLVIAFAIQPVNVLHLTDYYELIAVRTDGAIVVKAICQVRIATDHMGRFRRNTRHRVMNTAALPGNF